MPSKGCCRWPRSVCKRSRTTGNYPAPPMALISKQPLLQSGDTDAGTHPFASTPIRIQEVSSKLIGTVALVTGASSGIGRATARALAEEGASVVVVARRKDRLDALVGDIERSGGKAHAIGSDITDRANAEAAIQQAVAHFGRLDI